MDVWNDLVYNYNDSYHSTIKRHLLKQHQILKRSKQIIKTWKSKLEKLVLIKMLSVNKKVS